MSRPWYKRILGLLTKGSAERVESLEEKSRKATLKRAQAMTFTVGGLNLEAAHRQSQLGKDYRRNTGTKKRLAELKQGTVVLPPHRAWTGDYTDWAADPFNDLNWRFQFHTLRWINPYLWDARDGNEESKTEWKRIVHSWAEHNTPPERAADRYAWIDMTDGNRAIQVSLGAPLIQADEDWYVDLLVQHRNWLLDDANIVDGNHGLHQNLGLFVVSVVLHDDLGTQLAIDRLGEQILEVFDEDGLNEEGSVAYHEMNLVWWLQAQERLKLEGYDLPTEAWERLENAGRTMGFLLLPDGTKPQIGDGGRGIARPNLHPFVDQVRQVDVHEENLPTFQHYTNGFTVFRSGWGENQRLEDESHTIIRHGVDLERHSHSDRGSIHLYTAGRRWITDGGFHSYQHREPNRVYTKSRLAHSLVDLPNQEHDITGEVPVALLEHNDAVHSIEIVDENFESAVWRRRVVFLPQDNIWVIWDRIQANEPDEIHQQWLVDLGIEVNHISQRSVELQDGDKTLRMQWLGDAPILDTFIGDPKSDSKRGLVGVGWKKMKPGTSIHANFHAKNVESIVVISDPTEQTLNIDLTDKEPMRSFSLKIGTSNKTCRLDFTGSTTELRQML